MKLGFSTGAIFRKVPSVSKKIIEICREIGCSAIELSVKTQDEVELLSDLIDSGGNFDGFEYVSMHSPDISVTYGKNPGTINILEKLFRAYSHFKCENLVIHPDVVKDWKVFENFPFNLAIENMSKDIAPLYLPDQMESFFENGKYSMTFDVKHAFESASGKDSIARDLYEKFKDRIVQIHLSGYNPNATKHEHRPLIAVNQPEIVNFVKDKQHIPIIIESDCEDADQMKAEYEYVKNLLES